MIDSVWNSCCGMFGILWWTRTFIPVWTRLYQSTIIFSVVIVFQSFRYSVGIGKEPIECVWVHNKWYLVAVYYNGLLLKDLFFVLPQFGSEPSGNTGTSNCFLKTGIQIRKHPIHHQGKLKPVVWTDLNQIFVIAIKFCAGDNIITFGTILVE